MKTTILSIVMIVLCNTVFSEITPDKIIDYKSVGDVTLKMSIFNPESHKESDQKPAIVFFSGGGWVKWSPDQFFRQCEYLASRGMVAIYAEYRTQNHYGGSPKECVKDGKSAMRWIRSHAKELGINPDMIAAGGGSAGGHVAAATATLSGFNEDGEDTSVSCKPNALVLFNPVFDNSVDGYGYDRVQEYWKEFSPMHNIDENTPATIVFLGTKDKLIPVETAEKYKKIMEKAGNRCELFLYKDQTHGFFNHDRYYETLLEADKFLTSLGYLKGEPTIKKENSTEQKGQS
ncbi:MAG: alpha/beta hydrolase [Sedimentisphaeraceae bacterium JB056]